MWMALTILRSKLSSEPAVRKHHHIDYENVIDGMLTFEEFKAGFDLFDTNGNGTIDKNEMNSALA
jgi:Ca2+-binding EF-hand superfamily protein